MEVHGFSAYYNKDSKILILGSFPSVVSREKNFYYAYPQNRFWPVLAKIYGEEIADDIASKKAFLKRNKIALFDVVAKCDIKASSDASIKNVVPNDISAILENSQITKIYTTGRVAYDLYNKFLRNKTGIEAIMLPSTSPLNARYKFNDLVLAYQVIKDN